jgi:hypothetical protein
VRVRASVSVEGWLLRLGRNDELVGVAREA